FSPHYSSDLLILQSADVSFGLTHRAGFENTAHDLSRTSLGQHRYKLNLAGDGNRANFVLDVFFQFVNQLITASETLPQQTVGVNDIAAHIIWHTDASSLSHRRMADQTGFDFGCTEAIAADLDDIINTTNDMIIAIFIFAGRVARKIPTLLGIGAEVRLDHA